MPLIIPAAYPQVGVGGQFSQNPLPPGNGGSGGGNVDGPTTSLLRSIAVWLDSAGRQLGDSAITIDAGGNMVTPGLIDGRDVGQDGVVLDGVVAQLVNLPTAGQKAALVGSDGTPSGANPYVTDSDPRLVGGGFALPAGQLGGSLASPTVLGIRETGGPTLLTFGIVPTGSVLQRQGSVVVGLPVPFVNRSLAFPATDYVITLATYVGVTSTAAARLITLPLVSAVADGWEIEIADLSKAAGNPHFITVRAAGGDTINGVAGDRFIKIPGDSVKIMRANGAWVFTKTPGLMLDVSQFGRLYADGIGDDYAVIQAALDAGPAVGSDVSGFRVFLPRGRYRTSQTLKLRRCIIFEGEGSGSFSGYGTTIVPDKGCQGLVISGVFDSGIAGMRADFAIVRNLVVQFPAGAQTTTWAATTAYSTGDLITPTAAVPAHHWVFECTTAGTTAGSQPDFTIPDLGDTVVDGTVTWTARSINGIDVKVKSTIENVSIINSPGNGVYLRGAVTDTPSTNCNEWVMRRVTAMGAKMNGFFIDGRDANAGYAEKLFASTCGYWGVYDSSFLGNTHIGHDTDGNGLGPYKDDDANAKNIWLGCYSESGQPPSSIESNSVVIGGLHAAGFDGIKTGRSISAAVNGDTPFSVVGQQNGVTVALNSTSVNKYAMSVKHSGEAQDLRWQRDSAVTGNGWWCWSLGGLDNSIAYAVSGDTASDGGSHLWLRPSTNETHFFLGFQKQRIGTCGNGTLAAPAGTYKRGDWFFNNYADFQGATSFDGVMGWTYDKDGTAPWWVRHPFFGHANQKQILNGVGSPYAVSLRADAGVSFHNAGATAKVYATLPATTGGALVYDALHAEYTFYCMDTDGIRLTTQDAAFWFGGQQAAGVYLESTTFGSTITVKCQSGSVWLVTKLTGTWTDGVSIFSTGGSSRVVVNVTSNTPLSNLDDGKSYTNFGAVGSVNLTSPATPNVGFVTRVRVMAAQALSFVLPAGHTLYVDDVVATTVGGNIGANTVGAHLEAEYVGNSKWFAQVSGAWVAS